MYLGVTVNHIQRFCIKQNISREATSFIMTVYACAKKLSCDDVKKENLLKKLIFF